MSTFDNQVKTKRTEMLLTAPLTHLGTDIIITKETVVACSVKCVDLKDYAYTVLKEVNLKHTHTHKSPSSTTETRLLSQCFRK